MLRLNRDLIIEIAKRKGGLSAVSRMLGTSRQNLDSMLQADKGCTLRTLGRLVDALGVPLGSLLVSDRADGSEPDALVAAFEARRKVSLHRVGHGYDIHRLKRGGCLMLAGVKVAEGFSPIAHSDGDVVLHAVTDALLGAMGLGDIGQSFPNTDRKWKGAASRIFVQATMEKIRAESFTVGNLDVTIMAERPRLAPFREAMTKNLAYLVGGVINVKAGTNEKCDSIGAGKAIAAHAVVLLTRSR